MSDHYVSIKTSTWSRESYGLYDYENKNRVKNKFKILSDSYLVQTNESLSLIPISSQLSTSNKYLLSLTKGQNCFTLNNNYSDFKSKNLSYEKPWLVLRNKKIASGYCLSEGDTLRLGKAKLKVKEINGPKQVRSQRSVPMSKNVYQGGLGNFIKDSQEIQIVNTFNSEDEGNNCRICLLEDNSKENPLVKPCKCAGSMGLIHIECLQKWFSSKVAMREFNNATSYSWKSLKCELCKFNYPDKLAVGEMTFDLMVIKKPENNYISLETGPKESKSINIISFQDKKNIRLGRGHDSDIRLSDISVSRNHAYIHLSDNGLFLTDVSSKFGTLVKIKKPIALSLGFKFGVQCGRHFIVITIKKQFRFFSCFGGCGKKKGSDDEDVRSVRDATEECVSIQI